MASQRRTVPDGQRESTTEQRAPVLYVVEDDVATLELLREVAADAGWDSRGFTRIAPLRRALQDETPSLLVLDDDLPDGRGGDLARELRQDPRLAGMKLLVCTAAHPTRQAEITAWAPVVSKPFDLGQIERYFELPPTGTLPTLPDGQGRLGACAPSC